MLSLLLLIPIIGSLLLLTIPENSIENKIRMKRITLITMLINFLISIYILLEFDSSTSQYQFVYEFIELSYCHLNIGIDGISLYFVLSFLLLETLQIGVFVVLDLLLFYIFFESVLPILFLIIIVYGSGEARIRSALLFFLYTLAGSLFMLLAILQIYSYVGSTDFQIISLSEINLNSQKIL